MTYPRTQINDARELWLSGIPEPTIAERLEVDQQTIERWRDEEHWQKLARTIERVAATKILEQTAEADRADFVMARTLRVKLAKRITSTDPSELDLVKMTTALERIRKVEDRVNRSIHDTEGRRKLIEDGHAA